MLFLLCVRKRKYITKHSWFKHNLFPTKMDWARLRCAHKPHLFTPARKTITCHSDSHSHLKLPTLNHQNCNYNCKSSDIKLQTYNNYMAQICMIQQLTLFLKLGVKQKSVSKYIFKNDSSTQPHPSSHRNNALC